MQNKTIATMAGVIFSLIFFASVGFASTMISLPGVGYYSGIVDGENARFGVGFDDSGLLVGAATGVLGIVAGEVSSVSDSLFLGNFFGAQGARGPVAVLLDQAANSFTFTFGYINAVQSTPQKFIVTLIDDLGHRKDILFDDVFASITGYNTYTIQSDSDISTFRRVLFGPNTDRRGWAYGQMSYTAVPVPAAVWLLGTGIAGLVLIRRRT